MADAVLTAKDLGDTRLQADLVTLSACQSGVNVNHSGEELIGLTRAILHSGASSVLVSLWTVDDYSTALLMREFYTRLLTIAVTDSGSRWAKAQALRHAQLAVLRTTAADVVDGLTRRLTLSTGDTEVALLLDLASAHALAGDLDGALTQCERAVVLSTASTLSLSATQLAESLRFQRAVRERRGKAEHLDWSRCVFDHPAYWAGFVLVGDWASRKREAHEL
jgi:CHAT domain-containing protein